MDIPVAYHYIPTNPLDYALNVKRALKTKVIKDIEEFEKQIEKPLGYINILLLIETSYAGKIKRFQEKNNLDIEETCKVLKITKEQYDKYMELLL